MTNNTIDQLELYRKFLDSAVKAADKFGTELVVNVLKQIEITPSATDQLPSDPKPSENDSFSLVKLVEDKTGIELNRNLRELIETSTDEQVLRAISSFQKYENQMVHNPEGLFYKILINQKNT
jgi:hypothetical protein